MGSGTHREWSLVFFTTLTQLAVGTFVLWGLSVVFFPSSSLFSAGMFPLAIVSTVLSTLVLGGLAAATHLGRPVGAVFSLSNWRNSWLSREAFLAAGFGLLVAALLIRRMFGFNVGLGDHLLILTGCISGFSLVWGISSLYRLRTVPAWDNWGTTAAFFTTSMLTGTLMVMIIWILLGAKADSFIGDPIDDRVVLISRILIFLLVGVQTAIFSATMIYLIHEGGAGAESVRILWGKQRSVLVWRWLLAGFGAVLLIFFRLPVLVLLSCSLLLISEILGRFLFYAFYQRKGY